MDKFTVIEAVIQKHGARAVYEATFEWEGGDYAPLVRVSKLSDGFCANAGRCGQVPYIAYIASHRMSAEERAMNYWEGSLDLHRRQG